jgi:hypothetical protein
LKTLRPTTNAVSYRLSNLVGTFFAFDVSGVMRDLGARGPVLEDS